MLLRSITKHVRDQNWFAVFLDFFIVVFGVFMGLQVSNLNTARQQGILADNYLLRLHADMTRSINSTQFMKAFMQNNANNIALVNESLKACRIEEARKDNFANGLLHAGKLVPASLISGTLDEMRSTGGLGLIKNLQVRDAINEVIREIEHQNRVWGAIHGRASGSHIYIDQRVIFSPKTPKGGTENVSWDALDIEFEKLCEDRKFQGSLSSLQRLASVNVEWLDRNLANFHRVKDAIDTELNITPEIKETTP